MVEPRSAAPGTPLSTPLPASMPSQPGAAGRLHRYAPVPPEALGRVEHVERLRDGERVPPQRVAQRPLVCAAHEPPPAGRIPAARSYTLHTAAASSASASVWPTKSGVSTRFSDASADVSAPERRSR